MVIFLPIAFMGGIVGRFFSSFGFVVAFSVVMSLFVSFTLTPMLCSRFLKLERPARGHAKSKDGFIWRADRRQLRRVSSSRSGSSGWSSS